MPPFDTFKSNTYYWNARERYTYPRSLGSTYDGGQTHLREHAKSGVQSPNTHATRLHAHDLQALTSKEVVTLVLIARGHSNDEIAHLLFLSPHTIKNRIERIFTKLNARNRANAVARGFMIGALVSPLLDF